MESRMLMLFMFLVFSCSVFASDTGEEIRKIHEILKQQQLEILKLQNENKSFKIENKLLTKNVDRLNEIISRMDQTQEDPEGKTALHKRVEDPKQSTFGKGTHLYTPLIISFFYLSGVCKRV